MDDFSAENQEKVIMKWIKDNAYHLGNVMNAFRLALVGEGKGPHIFDITVLLGKEETVSRLKKPSKPFLRPMYNFIIRLYACFVRLVSPFHKKAKQMVCGQKTRIGSLARR